MGTHLQTFALHRAKSNAKSNLIGGGKRDRTADLLHAMQALSQLSYTPAESRALYKVARRIAKQQFTLGFFLPRFLIPIFFSRLH